MGEKPECACSVVDGGLFVNPNELKQKLVKEPIPIDSSIEKNTIVMVIKDIQTVDPEVYKNNHIVRQSFEVVKEHFNLGDRCQGALVHSITSRVMYDIAVLYHDTGCKALLEVAGKGRAVFTHLTRKSNDTEQSKSEFAKAVVAYDWNSVEGDTHASSSPPTQLVHLDLLSTANVYSSIKMPRL